MMQALITGLDAWGVPESSIYYEAFGPASIRPGKQPVPVLTQAEAFRVHYSRTKTQVRWDGAFDNLLACAEAHSVPLNGGCRAGNCGTCAAVLTEGEVAYLTPPMAPLEPGTCLTCIAVPTSDLTLDA